MSRKVTSDNGQLTTPLGGFWGINYLLYYINIYNISILLSRNRAYPCCPLSLVHCHFSRFGAENFCYRFCYRFRYRFRYR